MICETVIMSVHSTDQSLKPQFLVSFYAIDPCDAQSSQARITTILQSISLLVLSIPGLMVMRADLRSNWYSLFPQTSRLKVNIALVHRILIDECTRMGPVEENHDQDHERRVEDVEIDLVRQENAVLAHDILADTENGSDQD
jgi:hypothetical protein